MRLLFISLLSFIIISIGIIAYFSLKESDPIDNNPIKTNVSKTIKNDKSSNNNLDIKNDKMQLNKVDVTKKIKPISIVAEKQTNLQKNDEEKAKFQTINNLDTDDSKNLVSEDHLFLITILSLIVAFLSIAVSLYLYYWRYILISKNKFAIPENIVKEMSNQSDHFKNLSEYNVQVFEFVQNQSKTSNSNIAELKNILVQFQKTLNEKDNLINRYQEGYDNKIFKNFIGRFYRVYKFLIDLEKKSEISVADVNKIKIFLEDALDQSGVEVFYPQIGINYLEEGEILDDRPIVKITNNESDDNKVLEINSPGLRFVEESINNRIIMKSKVTILQFREDV